MNISVPDLRDVVSKQPVGAYHAFDFAKYGIEL